MAGPDLEETSQPGGVQQSVFDFPWVKVNCLASKALSMAVRRLADDWQAHHGVRPVLVETFVDRARFEATCYRAANWHDIGLTQGRKASAQVEGKTRKSVYVRPLVRHFKAVLLNGPRPAVRRRKAAEPPRLAADGSFVQVWGNIIDTAVAVAHDHDRVWQRRRRVLNTLLIMLFIFRLCSRRTARAMRSRWASFGISVG